VCRGNGRIRRGEQLGDGRVEKGQVEIELAREVLVEHRLGDPGALGDLVHSGRVIAVRRENLEGRLQQLGATLGLGQARGAGGLGGHVMNTTDG
jgi:hypothetical protein